MVSDISNHCVLSRKDRKCFLKEMKSQADKDGLKRAAIVTIRKISKELHQLYISANDTISLTVKAFCKRDDAKAGLDGFLSSRGQIEKARLQTGHYFLIF